MAGSDGSHFFSRQVQDDSSELLLFWKKHELTITGAAARNKIVLIRRTIRI
jgi:hypothetical protein